MFRQPIMRTIRFDHELRAFTLYIMEEACARAVIVIESGAKRIFNARHQAAIGVRCCVVGDAVKEVVATECLCERKMG